MPPRPSGYDHDAIAETRDLHRHTEHARTTARARLRPRRSSRIGGGTGSYNLLSGLKHRDCRLTAVVTTMDSGGSSGRLRDEFGHLPPGDLRQCLLALSPDDHSGMVLRGLFNYRFDKGNGLDGHSFGNLFLTALTEITGSAERAINEMGRLLNIKGRVLPVTLANADLCARLRDGSVIVGETNIDRRSAGSDAPIDYVYLEPSTAQGTSADSGGDRGGRRDRDRPRRPLHQHRSQPARRRRDRGAGTLLAASASTSATS